MSAKDNCCREVCVRMALGMREAGQQVRTPTPGVLRGQARWGWQRYGEGEWDARIFSVRGRGLHAGEGSRVEDVHVVLCVGGLRRGAA